MSQDTRHNARVKSQKTQRVCFSLVVTAFMRSAQRDGAPGKTVGRRSNDGVQAGQSSLKRQSGEALMRCGTERERDPPSQVD
eukprot:3534262-Prymnesium_polylepis.1